MSRMNFHTHIQPQLNEIIADLLSEANPAESFHDALKKPQWWTSSEYKDMPLRYEAAELSIKEWMSAVEVITGDNTAFNLALIQQIHDTIEYQWDIKMQAWSDDSRYEHELQMERAAVA